MATCVFHKLGYNCDGTCVNPSSYTYQDGNNEGDVICEDFLVVGSTDENACNFNPAANANDASCDFLSCLVFDCSNPLACRFNPDADFDDEAATSTVRRMRWKARATTTRPPCPPIAITPAASVALMWTPKTSTQRPPFKGLHLPGCMVLTACNFDPQANTDDGSCEFLSCIGCLNENACNYDPMTLQRRLSIPLCRVDCNGDCLDDDGDGVCNFDEIEGCTDEDAFNFDPLATEEDGSCVAAVEGCTQAGACNYDVSANVNDGSCEFESCSGCLSDAACNYAPEAIYPAECIYPEEGYNCDGVCLSDVDGDGVCDMFESEGCTLVYACNYNPFVTVDDGSCDFSCVGCTDPNACNFDPSFTIDDGSYDYLSCLVFGCSNPRRATSTTKSTLTTAHVNS